MEPSKYVTKTDIREALRTDSRFRELFPEIMSEIKDFLLNPSCPCHEPLVNKIMKATDRLKVYFPNKEMPKVISGEYQNLTHVINCNISELDAKLKRLPPGRKQISLARYEDQITAVIDILVKNL